MVEFAEFLTRRGFVAISIDYRLARDKGTVPEEFLTEVDKLGLPNTDQALAMYPAGSDAKAAVRWLHNEADALGVHPDYISVIGGSAGSYLTMMLGVTEAEDLRDELQADEDPTLASTHLESPAHVHTLIDHWGGTALVALLEIVWGRSRWDQADVPVSIVHGTLDKTVPFLEAEKISDYYEQHGLQHEFHALEGQGHGPWKVEVDGQSLAELGFDFIVDVQTLELGRR